MRRFAWLAVVLAAIVAIPASSGAWGMSVHKLITAQALGGLPQPMRTFFAPSKAYVAEHAADPDLWRTAGLKGDMGPEEPNHFFDIDDMDEPAPYTNVLRDRDAIIARYGLERAEKIGRLPFRIAEMYGRVVAAFKVMGTGGTYGGSNARYLSAILAHYIEDAYQPLHVSKNYDGQLTNQRGIHSRFETMLPMRNWSHIMHRPVQVKPIPDLNSFVFTAISESAALVPQVLEADRVASVGLAHDANNRLIYDDAYYAKFFQRTRPILDSRLNGAADAVASLIMQAWTDAGKPAGQGRVPYEQ